MSRSMRRWLAFARAQWKRASTTAVRALTTDEDVTVHRAPADVAEAEAFFAEASSLGAAVAKLAQLRAYLEAPGAERAAEARAVLGRLWDSMPPVDPAVVRRVIEEDLGAPPERLFTRFDERPLAAASLGQVHAAELDGEKLAVKVQYLGVAEALKEDLASRAVLKRLVGADLGGAVPPAALEQLRDKLLAELDYRQEARELAAFAAATASQPTMVLPRVRADRSSARVLTMTRLEGQPLPAFAAAASDEERARVAATIFRFAWGAALHLGRINADPNPGNYLVLDGAAGKVGFVDFGCVAELDEPLLEAERKLWMAIIRREGEDFRYAVHEEGLVGDAAVFEGATFREWEAALSQPFLAQGEFRLEPAHAAQLVGRTWELLHLGKMSLPAGAMMLWRQRLGTISVLASLRPRMAFRAELARLLDDGGHHIPLIERYP